MPPPTYPRLGLNPGQLPGLVICIQDHKGHEGTVDVPPLGLSLLAIGLHTHAHLHAEGETGREERRGKEGCCPAGYAFPRPCYSPVHKYLCTHTT